MKQLVFQFWDYSLGRTSAFNFSVFFGEFDGVLYRKLASHGCLGLGDYIEVVMKKYYDMEKLRFLEYKSVHTDREFMLTGILEGIFGPRYEHQRSKHISKLTYVVLLDLYQEIKFYDKFTHLEKMLLVDRCIHAMHNSGTLLDIGKIREEYDRGNEVLR